MTNAVRCLPFIFICYASTSVAQEITQHPSPFGVQQASLSAPLVSSEISSVTAPSPEDRKKADQAIEISVRAVYAQQPLEEGEVRGADALFDNKLSDIKTKLEKLPFHNFRLLSEETDDVQLREKNSIRLSNGQKVCLRAVDETADSVTLWLRWADLNGATLLDTRMNFAKGETMVAGVESDEENAAVVLAIKVMH